MAFLSQFISVTSTSSQSSSSWIYLVNWILALILSLAFIFYFNRLLGFVISYLFKLLLWKSYQIRINVESVKLAPLGGRLLLKNLTIITSNSTISVLRFNLTWRYWLFKITRLSNYYFNDMEETDHEVGGRIRRDENDKLPCRILLMLDGLEVFMYNRTMAYDQIVELLEKKVRAEGKSASSSFEGSSKIPSSDDSHSSNTTNSNNSDNEKATEGTQSKEIAGKSDIKDSSSSTTLYFLLSLLPIRIKIKKGAMVMGNATTPSILVANYKSANGLVDISKSPNPLDSWRFLHDFSLQNFQLWLKPNIGYEKHKYISPNEYVHLEPNINNNLGAKTELNRSASDKNKNLSHYKKYKQWYKFERAAGAVQKAFRKVYIFRKHNTQPPDDSDEFEYHWRGLRRYVGEDADRRILSLNTEEEYAKFSLILDSMNTRIVYYYDTPGVIPLKKRGTASKPSLDPEHGIEMEISKATIHYGPWADRQRVPLQSMFFPSIARDSEETLLPTKHGALRQYAGFKITMIVKDEVILRVPTREPTKDKEILRRSGGAGANGLASKATRPFGWIEVKMGEGSNINSFTSYTASRKEGWPNTLQVLFSEAEIRTSVNHDVLFMADSHEIKANIGFPLEWNGKCTWTFDMTSDNAKMFFLREHTMLFSDIFADFASGEPTPYESFRPFVYKINWKMNDYKLYLNVNDENVINNPLDFNNNKYLSFQGESLDIHLNIPLNGSFAKSTTFDFEVRTSYFNLVLDTPPWHTANAFMKDSNIMGKSGDFTVDGTYTMFSSVEMNTSDYIEIRCLGDYVTLKFYGFVIKYLFLIRENYFGDNIHFKTFEEYTSTLINSSESETSSTLASASGKVESKNPAEKDFDYWKILKTDNDVDILFTFQVRHGLVVLPYNIYNCSSHIGLTFDALDVDIRFCNYYMDLMCDVSPISAVFIQDCKPHNSELFFDIPKYRDTFLSTKTPDVKFDGLTIHAHRMFGIPPEEITYHCKWDFTVTEIEFDSRILTLVAIKTCIKNFIFGYKDVENALNTELPMLYDITNLSFRCPVMRFKLSTDLPGTEDLPSVFVQVNLHSFLFNFNDACNDRYNKVIGLHIPNIDVMIIESNSKGNLILGYLKTSLIFDDFCQKPNKDEITRDQRAHMKFNDAPFHRCPFLVHADDRDDAYNDAYGCFLTTLTLPDICAPLNADTPNGVLNDNESYFFESESDDSLSTSTLESEEELCFNKLPPTQRYDEDDFRPSYDPDPLYDYDNIVLDLGEVQSFVTPKALLCLAKLTQSMSDNSEEVVMDALQTQIVKYLRSIISPIHTIVNLRFVTPDISIQFGYFEASDPSEILSKSHNVPIVHFQIVEPSLAMSIKKSKDANEQLHNLKEESTIALHLKEILITLSNPSEFKNPFLFNIKEVEFWASSEEDSVMSSNIEKIEVQVNDDQIEWIIDFVKSLEKELAPVIKEFAKKSPTSQSVEAELVYKLAIGSMDYHIDHDPGVLTKPAYILRSRKEHIRFFDGWKVMTRLRHVLNYMPPEWYESKQCNLGQPEFQLPGNAVEEVVLIFSRWRSWEANHEQRSYFFSKIFSDSTLEEGGVGDPVSEVKSETNQLSVSISETTGKITKSKKEFDFITVQDLTTILKVTNGQTGDDGLDGSFMSIEGVLNVLAYKSKLSSITLDVIKRTLNLLDSDMHKEEGDLFEKDEEKSLASSKSTTKKNFNLSFVSNLNNFQQHIILPNSSFEIVGVNIVNAMTMIRHAAFEDDIYFTFESRSDLYELNAWSAENRILTSRASNFEWLVACAGAILGGVKNVDISLGKFVFKIMDENNTIVSALDKFIKVDLEYLSSIPPNKQWPATPDPDPLSTSGTTKENFLEKVGDISLNVVISEFIWSLDFMKPLTFNGVILDNFFSFTKVSDVLFLQSLIEMVDFNTSLDSVHLLESQNSQILTKVKLTKAEDLFLCAVTCSIGYTKLFSPQLLQTIETLIAKEPLLVEKVKEFQKCCIVRSKEEGTSEKKIPDDYETKKRDMSLLDKLGFNVKLTNDYIGVSTFVDNTKFSYEVEMASLGVYNVASVLNAGGNSINQVVPLYGDIVIPTARIYILDRTIPVGLSNIIDINVAIKIFNDMGAAQDSRSLQLESQYCRICLGSSTLFKIVGLLDRLEQSTAKLADRFSTKKGNIEVDERPDTPSTSDFKLSAVHLLSYNFCLGWIYDIGSKEYPGVILGAERFFAVSEQGLGKFTLMEAFLSVANGSRSSNYYSTQSEKASLNRAFLPTMQLIYTTQKDDDRKVMKLQINGDELDVKFLSTSIIMLEYVVNSVTQVQKFFNKRAKVLAAGMTKPAPETCSDDLKDPLNSIHAAFDSIELVAIFAGSNVLFYRLDDDENGETPSLYLHSPAVKIAFKYDHQKLEKKKHIVKGEILTSSSTNTLHASCVPVIVDLVAGVRKMMQNSNPDEDDTKSIVSEEAEIAQPSMKGRELSNLLNETDIHFGLRIEKQELTLSCEPTAKVAAIVGLEGIYIQLNSGDNSIPSLILTILFDSMSTSLQHIYSREISGSVTINKVLLSSSFEFDETPSVLSSGCLMDVDAYINVKQYQDLELFKDIWFPKQYFERYSSFVSKKDDPVEVNHRSALASNKNISNRFKEVSTSYAVPWVVSFVITNLSVQVDFGPSLCNSKLKFDRLWAVSKKSTDWSQDLKAGINLISLEAEGRLGGTICITNINVHTAISWKLQTTGEILDVPLILLSGGIEKLHVKLSFDSHVFAIANIENFSTDIFNQKSEISISKDHLFVATKFDTAEVYITSLTASNCLDIFNTVSRMIQENRRSYKETLRDSSKGTLKNKSLKRSATDDILETVKKLETKIEVIAGHLLIHVYPTSFDDSKVLVIKLDESKANFQQNEYSSGISNELELQFNDLVVSLSVTSPVPESFINQCTVEEFVEYAYKARGGTIFIFPSFKISMRTFQKYNEYLIEYLYQSSFDGTVDIRWNLGSVNFIREMYAIHKKALDSRTEYKKKLEGPGFKEDIFATQGTHSSKFGQSLDDEDPTAAIDQAINESISKVSARSKYTYSPLAPPIIEAPQLKELGNATPPLEWFGLNRDNFPNVTHQLGIVSMQKLIHEVESRYSKILGKA
ncbi:uncharacterized protein RJT20DRAFT_123813 [Scheffersomyces xylosifermentans]|uniref:uncharacterized protein n=1 Tax=Scheffersomyces xylosifermentans TaxID=1304137 RepID=UPI00315D86EF